MAEVGEAARERLRYCSNGSKVAFGCVSKTESKMREKSM